MNEKMEELLTFYALDAVTDAERQQVEAYVAANPEARLRLDEMLSTASVLAYASEPLDPPPALKRTLMDRVNADQRAQSSKQNQPSRPRVMRLGNIFQAFSMGVATVAIVWAVILNTQLVQLRNEVSSLRKAVVAQANSLEQINQSVDQINAKLPQTTPSAVITVSLKGTDVQPQAQGQLITDPTSDSAVLVIVGLPQLEAGKTYQVWLIQGNAPVSAGLLKVDENGQGVLILTSEEEIGSFNALGISIEPAGGSSQPTGDLVVLSEL